MTVNESPELSTTEDTTSTEPLVTVSDLKKYYGDSSLLGNSSVKAVDGVDLKIHRGETLGLVGESGCGKTTLGRTLIGLETPTAGSITYDGRDITNLRGRAKQDWRRNAQIVFQDPESSLNARMTVGEVIAEPLAVHDWGTKTERSERVKQLLTTVGLQEEHYYRYPHQFSGGQQQRIAIARALAPEPEFIVLDEPVSALDASVQAKVLNLLVDLQRKFGLTYLFIAHDLSVVRHLCDRVAVMYLGTIMERGPTEALFSDPANPYAKALLSAIPTPDPAANQDRITLRGTPPSPRDPPTGCPFSTRCPMKLRPPNHDLDPEEWYAIDVLSDVFRERMRATQSVGDRVRSLLGRQSRFASIEELSTELLADVTLPPSAQESVDAALALAADGNDQAALNRLLEAFGSVCDDTVPEEYDVATDSWTSRCHRHRDEYPDPPGREEY
ncbi:MAG: ABC transporter ATP-binding protein [Halobacteriales archaeon]